MNSDLRMNTRKGDSTVKTAKQIFGFITSWKFLLPVLLVALIADGVQFFFTLRPITVSTPPAHVTSTSTATANVLPPCNYSFDLPANNGGYSMEFVLNGKPLASADNAEIIDNSGENSSTNEGTFSQSANGLAMSIATNNVVPTLPPGTKLPAGGVLKSPDVTQLGILPPPKTTVNPTIDDVRFGTWQNTANGCSQYDVIFGTGLTDQVMANEGLPANGGPAYKIAKTHWNVKQLIIDLTAA